MSRKTCVRYAVSITAMVLPSSAFGQQAVDSSNPSGSSGDVLEDIVVTAQKRSERLQDTPIAVTAITANAIAAARMDTTQDLQFSVPNLVFTSFTGNAQPFLRGIGSDITGANGDPSVATYIDGVYSAGSFQSIISLLGVERIEVLKGPQGTLYGRNAVGGAINIYTLNPSQDVRVRISASAGNFDRKEANGYFSGGIAQDLSLGVYFAFRQRDSYLKQVVEPRPSGEPDDETEFGGRVKAVYEPSEDLRFIASLERTRADLFDGAAVRQIQPNATGFAMGGLPIIQRDRLAADGGDYFKPRNLTGSFTAEIGLGPVEVRSITAFHDFKVFAGTDADATTAQIFNQPALPSKSKDFSQELQLQSDPSSEIKWIVGAFYLRQRTGFYPLVAYSNVLFPDPIRSRKTNSDILLHSYAMFGQVTVPIFSGFNVTVGGRYTHDKKRFNADQTFFDAAGQALGPARLFGPFRKTWSKFNPKLSFDYKFGDNLFYATYSEGFKSGVYAASNPAAPGPADPEHLKAYEIGLKSDLFDRRVRFNTAAYYYDFKDLQVQIISPATGGTVQVQNAARSRTYGIEAELAALVTSELKLEAAGSYNHARYRDFLNAAVFLPAAVGNVASVIDATGNHTVKSPKWTASAGMTYTHGFGNGDEFNATAKYAYNSGFYWDTANTKKQGAYGTVNGSLDYSFGDSGITASVWATNLFNKRYYKALTTLAFGTIASDNEPRMYGVTLAWKLE